MLKRDQCERAHISLVYKNKQDGTALTGRGAVPTQSFETCQTSQIICKNTSSTPSPAGNAAATLWGCSADKSFSQFSELLNETPNSVQGGRAESKD